jgi:hypothetical protein
VTKPPFPPNDFAIEHDQTFAFRDTVIGLLHEFGFVL